MMNETKEDLIAQLYEAKKDLGERLTTCLSDLAAAGTALGTVRSEFGQLRGELAAVHEALKERDRTIAALKQKCTEAEDERGGIAIVHARLVALLERSPDASPLSTMDALAAVETALRFNRGELKRLEMKLHEAQARREGGTPNSPRAAADAAMMIDAKESLTRFEARFSVMQREHAAEVARIKRENAAKVDELEKAIAIARGDAPTGGDEDEGEDEEDEEDEEDADTLEIKLHAQVSTWLERTAPRLKSDDLDYATLKLTVLQPASEEDGTLYLEFRVEEESHFESDGSGGRVPGVTL